MGYTDSMSDSDKKMLRELVIRFAAGAGMIAAGIAALCNYEKTVIAVSSVLGACALAAGIISLAMRFFYGKSDGGGRLSISGIVWIFIAVLLFNTSLLQSLGSAVITITGAAAVCAAIWFFVRSMLMRSRKMPYISHTAASVMLCIAGVFLIVNARMIFEGMIVIGIGAYFIVNGTIVLYEWLGRLRYFRNFRGVE